MLLLHTFYHSYENLSCTMENIISVNLTLFPINRFIKIFRINYITDRTLERNKLLRLIWKYEIPQLQVKYRFGNTTFLRISVSVRSINVRAVASGDWPWGLEGQGHLFDQKVQKMGNFKPGTTDFSPICDKKSRFLDFVPSPLEKVHFYQLWPLQLKLAMVLVILSGRNRRISTGQAHFLLSLPCVTFNTRTLRYGHAPFCRIFTGPKCENYLVIP